MDLVTIIVPVYNTAFFLEKCLNSVFNQTYDNIQLIVVNDGSKDESELIIKKLLDKNNFLYLKKENGGLASARNFAFSYIKGDYIFYLDSDDYLEKDAISNLMKYRLGNDIVIGNYRYVFSSGKSLEKKDYTWTNIKADQMDINDLFNYFFGNLYGINACNKLYNYNFIKNSNVIFQPNKEIFAEDLLFNIKLIKYKPNIKIIDKITYNYYQNINSITYSYKPDLEIRYANLINNFIDYKFKNSNALKTFLICNAINCICYQQNNKKQLKKELILFRNTLIDFSLILSDLKYILSIKSLYKVDYMITIILFKSKLYNMLYFYQKLKRKVRNRNDN